MRILQVVGTLDRGGIENLLKNLESRMDQVDFDFVVHKENGAYEEHFSSRGCKIFVFGGNTMLHPIRYFRFLKKIIVENQYKVVHSHMNHRSGYILTLFKFLGVKHRIAHCHIGALEGPFMKRTIKWLSGKLLPLSATDYFTCSIKAGEWMFGKREIRKKGLTLIPNGVSSDKFKFSKDLRNKIRKAYKIDDRIVLGHVGRFNTQKNHKFIIEVASTLNDDYCFMLLGDGPLEREIKEEVEKRGLKNRIIFTGSVNNANEFYSSFDLFLLPSLYEGLPLTLVEAQFNGTPILAAETVTNEVDFNYGNIEFIELNTAVWKTKIVESHTRISVSDHMIESSGYDIQNVAKKIEKLYLECE